MFYLLKFRKKNLDWAMVMPSVLAVEIHMVRNIGLIVYENINVEAVPYNWVL